MIQKSVFLTVLLLSGTISPARAVETLYTAVTGNNSISRYVPSTGVSTGFNNTPSFGAPVGVAFDGAGNLFVTNESFSSITKYAYADGVLSTSGTQFAGGASGGLALPFGLAFDSSGNLYALNSTQNTIIKFTSTNGVLSNVGQVFASGATGGLSNPYNLAFDSAGNLFVTDYNINSITKFTSTGGVLSNNGTVFTSGTTGGLTGPTSLAFDAAGNLYVANAGSNSSIKKFAFTNGALSSTGTDFMTTGLDIPYGLAFDKAGDLFVSNNNSGTIVEFASVGGMLSTSGTQIVSGLNHPGFLAFSPAIVAPAKPAFFGGETALNNGVYYLAFPNGNYFGYYSYLTDPRYIYHFDLGYEYIFDAADGHSGIYLYDFQSGSFFYTSPTFPFPYLYDFTLNTVLYYYPDPSNPGHYNTNGVRYFYRFDTGKIIVK